MTLKERYLKAVAAQLSPATRDDIIAELDDLITTRMEARESELGRPLTEAEQEAVLRRIGHPLAVAAQYGSGPLHVVGPELYPWWMFGVKVALAALVLITVISAFARMLVGDVDVGQAIGQAFAGLFSGAMTIVGFATVGGFILERQKERPAFLREWRVQDLALFELAAFDVTRWTADEAPKGAPKWRMSPTACAIGSAAGWAVLVLAWAGVLYVGFDMDDLAKVSPVVGGVDYGDLLLRTWRLLYWPVILYGVTRVLYEGSRAFQPVGVRAAALAEFAFAVARVVGHVWLWVASPLSPVVRVDSLDAFIERARAIPYVWPDSIASIVMVCVAFGILVSLWEAAGHLARVFTGKPRRGGCWSANTALEPRA